jgi:membrane protease YdiL (CAAX protease family)
MANPESAPSHCEHRSLFRCANWHRRDAVIGLCLWLVLWAGVCLAGQAGLWQLLPVVRLAAWLILYIGVLVCYPAWVIRRRTAGPICLWPGTGTLVKELSIAVPTTLCLLMLIAAMTFVWKIIVGSSLPMTSQWVELSSRMDVPTAAIFGILAVMVGPVVEEVFFRGFLYNALRCVCPIVLAICMQSALFGVAHPYRPVGIVLAAFTGLALAVVYEWRKTLLAPVFVHAMFNCVGVIALFVALTANAKAPVLGVHGVRDTKGQVVVDQVFHQTGAEKAGLRVGDVILSYNDVTVSGFQQLVVLVRAGRVGDIVRIGGIRDGRRFDKDITLGPRGDASARSTPPAR